MVKKDYGRKAKDAKTKNKRTGRGKRSERTPAERERLDGVGWGGDRGIHNPSGAGISRYDDLRKGITPSLLVVLDKHPEHKDIFFDFIQQYNDDPLFNGTMREAQHMAMMDLILLLHVRYNLDAGSLEEVESQKENNKMVREMLKIKQTFMKDMSKRVENAYDRDQTKRLFDKLYAEDGEYKEVEEDVSEED
jgi:hypothetical protein